MTTNKTLILSFQERILEMKPWNSRDIAKEKDGFVLKKFSEIITTQYSFLFQFIVHVTQKIEELCQTSYSIIRLSPSIIVYMEAVSQRVCFVSRLKERTQKKKSSWTSDSLSRMVAPPSPPPPPSK